MLTRCSEWKTPGCQKLGVECACRPWGASAGGRARSTRRPGLGDLAGIAAVAGEEVEVLGEVEVNRPLVALHVVGGALAGLQVVAGEEEVFALGVLPVVPDGFAVEAPELVAGDLHGHGALVDEGVVGAVGVNHPDAVDLLPMGPRGST